MSHNHRHVTLLTSPETIPHLESLRQLLWFIPQNTLNLLHYLRCQLLIRLNSLNALINLLRPARPRNRTADMLILQHPRVGQGALRDAQLPSNRLQPLHDLQLFLPALVAVPLIHLLDEWVLVLVREPRVRRDAIVVLARQNARLERREDGQAHAGRLEAAQVVGLDALPGEHVVLRLFHQGADHVQPVGDAPRFGDLVGVPFRGAPVEGLARVDDVVEGPDRLLDRRVPVWAVGVDEVDVGEAQALEGEVEAFDYVLAGESDVVDAVGAVGAAPVDLDSC